MVAVVVVVIVVVVVVVVVFFVVVAVVVSIDSMRVTISHRSSQASQNRNWRNF